MHCRVVVKWTLATQSVGTFTRLWIVCRMAEQGRPASIRPRPLALASRPEAALRQPGHRLGIVFMLANLITTLLDGTAHAGGVRRGWRAARANLALSAL